MTTPAAAALPAAPVTVTPVAPTATDSAGSVAVPPAAIPEPTSAQLLGRVHAKLSDVETSVAVALHKMESVGECILAHLEQLAERAAAPIAAAASAVAAATPPPISTIAKDIAAVASAICSCGHDVLHTKGGCTAPNCTCTTPPAKK
jgi:hypothetical protein